MSSHVFSIDLMSLHIEYKIFVVIGIKILHDSNVLGEMALSLLSS